MQTQINTRTATGLVIATSMIASFGPFQAQADLIYELQALEGEVAGSHITGYITIQDAMIGENTWSLLQVLSFEFHTDFGTGYSWDSTDLIVSNLVAFEGNIGDSILIPTATGGTSGYSPDWRLDTDQHGMPGSISLGLGADNGSPLWNLVELGAGTLDYRSSPGSAAEPQWKLVLVPAPASTCTLMMCGLIGFRRRR